MDHATYQAFIKQESGNGYLFFLHTFTKRTDTHRIAVPKNSDGSCSGSCSSAKIIEMCPDEYGGGEYSETGKMTPAGDKCLCESAIGDVKDSLTPPKQLAMR